MSNETRILVSNLSSPGNFTSARSQGPGYHKQYDNLITFFLAFENWSGEFNLQGSLKLYPDDDTDWVDLKNLSDEIITIGDGSTDYDSDQTVNSRGNFVWIRATGNTASGEIVEIRYTY